MKFGVREICNVVFRATQAQKIGNKIFQKGQPVFYIDSAKTSTVEGAATTVYATGGRGNSRLIAWEGEKTLTFTVEDALLSPISFAMLSGAGLIKGNNNDNSIHFHQTSTALIDSNGDIDLSNALEPNESIDSTAPLYVLEVDEGGDLTGNVCTGCSLNGTKHISVPDNGYRGKTAMVDYYVLKNASSVSELQIDAENFAGYYYVEADTLFRRQDNGKDLPANLTLPNVKIQSNFTFSMASSGDPSTFTFTMDAFPGYTYFNSEKKVLCAIQIVDDVTEANSDSKSIFEHKNSDAKVEDFADSIVVSSAGFSNLGVVSDPNNDEIQNGTNVEGGTELSISATNSATVTYITQTKKVNSHIWTTVENNTFTVPSTSVTGGEDFMIRIIATKDGVEIPKDIIIHITTTS